MRAIVGLWRWRGNPLCRRTDRREAWLALWAVLLIAVGTPLAGTLTAEATHDALLRRAHAQQHERHRIWAKAVRVSVRPALNADPESAARGRVRGRVTVSWKGTVDGKPHTGTFVAHQRVRPGARFPVWTDGRGHLTSRPMSTRSASSHSLLAGLAAAAGTVTLLELARRLALRQVMRRRYAAWDEEWGRIGPDWGRAGTSS